MASIFVIKSVYIFSDRRERGTKKKKKKVKEAVSASHLSAFDPSFSLRKDEVPLLYFKAWSMARII